MKRTPSQLRKLSLLQIENWTNPIKDENDVFIKFDVKDTKYGYVIVTATTGPANHESLTDIANFYLKDSWMIFISPRGRLFAPIHATYLDGKKYSIMGNITLTDIGGW